MEVENDDSLDLFDNPTATEDYETEDDEDIESETLTGKWIGCANHTLQLTLKILDKDTKLKRSYVSRSSYFE